MNSLGAVDWQSILRRSQPLRVAVVLALPLLLLALVWFFRLREVGQDYRAALALESQLQQQLQARAGDVADVAAQRLALQDAERQVQFERWRLSVGEGMSELLDQLALSGHEHGLLFERIDVLEEQQAPGHIVAPLNIQVTGRFPGLHLWLQSVQQRTRLLGVERLTLSAVPERPGMVSARLRLNAYHPGEALPMPQSLADEPATEALAAAAFDPFRPWSSRRPVAGVGRIPLEQLEMVGSLSRGGQRQALLRSAGHLYRVQAGQSLGRDDGVVVRVDAHQVEVRERLYIAGGWQERSRYLALGKGAYGESTDEHVAEFADGGSADERSVDPGSAAAG